jgi:hypothetical protein
MYSMYSMYCVQPAGGGADPGQEQLAAPQGNLRDPRQRHAVEGQQKSLIKKILRFYKLFQEVLGTRVLKIVFQLCIHLIRIRIQNTVSYDELFSKITK